MMKLKASVCLTAGRGFLTYRGARKGTQSLETCIAAGLLPCDVTEFYGPAFGDRRYFPETGEVSLCCGL